MPDRDRAILGIDTRPSVRPESPAGHEMGMPIDSDTIPPMPRPLLNHVEAAGVLGISPATLYTWRSRKPELAPRAIRVGAALRYRLEDLEAWLAAREEFGDPGRDREYFESQRGRAAAVNAASMTRVRKPRAAFRAAG